MQIWLFHTKTIFDALYRVMERFDFRYIVSQSYFQRLHTRHLVHRILFKYIYNGPRIIEFGRSGSTQSYCPVKFEVNCVFTEFLVLHILLHVVFPQSQTRLIIWCNHFKRHMVITFNIHIRILLAHPPYLMLCFQNINRSRKPRLLNSYWRRSWQFSIHWSDWIKLGFICRKWVNISI